MDVVLVAYDLEETDRIEVGPRLIILPFLRKAIEMMLHDDKDRAMEYLKLARQVVRLYPKAVMTSRSGPQPFHGLLDDDEDEVDRDRSSCSREETCDEEHGFEGRDRDRHAYGRYEDSCKLDKREM